MSPGKQRRFNRLFASDGKTVIAALDHGIAGIAPLAGLQEPGRLISSIAAAGVDALIVTPGIVRGFAANFARAGIILRVDCGPTALTGEWAGTKPVVSVEEALCLGADAVVAMGIVGAPGETRSLHALTALAAACDRWGVVLVAEMLPGGFDASDTSSEQIAVAARVGAEVGADVIKIRYSGSTESFRTVTSACYVPVVMLGGSKQSLQQLRTSTCDALTAGAKGVAVGRNIWQADDPGHVVAMLREAVHD
jgi:DhnA family fructose-bisphosphate aldolase class Ia